MYDNTLMFLLIFQNDSVYDHLSSSLISTPPGAFHQSVFMTPTHPKLNVKYYDTSTSIIQNNYE